MSTQCVINVDLADVWAEAGRKKFIRTIAWGDEVTVTAQTSTNIEIETVSFNEQPDGSILPVKEVGFIEPTKSSGIKTAEIVRPRNQNDVLKVNFVDVQQGDGSVIESPDGKVILVDGGDNQMFARYLAGRFRGTTAANPKKIDCILVTHGDADHFAGLPEIFKSETNKVHRKRLFIEPKRYYHNGIVKRPGTKNGKSGARCGTPRRDAQGWKPDVPYRPGGQLAKGARHGDECPVQRMEGRTQGIQQAIQDRIPPAPVWRRRRLLILQPGRPPN